MCAYRDLVGEERNAEVAKARRCPGEKLLKVVGILGIVFAVIGLMSQIGVEMMAIGIKAAAETGAVGLTNVSVPPLALRLTAFAISVYILYALIIGLVHRATPEKGEYLRVLGVVWLVAQLVQGIVGTSMAPGLHAIMIMSVLISVILPILYITGATMNAKAYRSSKEDR